MLKKVQDLLIDSHYGDNEEDDKIEREQIRYAELLASIDHPYKDVERHILLWIAGDDTEFRIYVGGSSCWIRPGSHYLSFEAIDETLLPIQIERDTSIWWIIADRCSLYRVHIVAEEQVIENFPDL